MLQLQKFETNLYCVGSKLYPGRAKNHGLLNNMEHKLKKRSTKMKEKIIVCI